MGNFAVCFINSIFRKVYNANGDFLLETGKLKYSLESLEKTLIYFIAAIIRIINQFFLYQTHGIHILWKISPEEWKQKPNPVPPKRFTANILLLLFYLPQVGNHFLGPIWSRV